MEVPKIFWFFEELNDPETNNIQRMMYLVEQAGMEAYSTKYIPHGGMTYPFLPTDRPVVAFGSIGMMSHVMRIGNNHKHVYPCAWMNLPRLRCSVYYSYWGEYLLQQKYAFYPLSEVLRLREQIYSVFGKDNQIFVRPDTNTKDFTGQIVHLDQMKRFVNSVSYRDPLSELMCVVAQPQEIKAEYRLIVHNKEVITGSRYILDGHLDLDPYYPEGAVQVAESAVRVWSPHPILAIDVADTHMGFRIIECGSVNCAGLYMANLDLVIQAITEQTKEEWFDTQPPFECKGRISRSDCV